MSIVSAIITRVCTAHASDSFITQLKHGNLEVKERQRSKIIRVPYWRGAMAYWGLARVDAQGWSTLNWLENRAQQASRYSSAEEFATDIAIRLTQELSKMHLDKPTDRGIGIHFTAYERIDGYWIPELFLISNWLDTSYTALRPGGMGVTRETFHAVSGSQPDEKHREFEYRLKVHAFLQDGKILGYNNGDPILYNPAANALFTMFQAFVARSVLAAPDAVETWTSLARRPIEIVSKAQRDFCRPGRRAVGGKPHDLAVRPNGAYISTTGD